MVIQSVQSYFDARAETFDTSFKRCGWQSPESQELRFWAMSKNLDLSQSLIVDAGCGDGSLFRFLNEHDFEVRYIGIDISEKMIEKARDAYPLGLFIASDFKSHDFDSDYVLSSGAFNLNTGSSIDTVYEDIAHLFNKADVAISVCLLSDKGTDQTDTFRYFNPEQTYTFATQLTPYVILDHSYARNDFCLTLFKR